MTAITHGEGDLEIVDATVGTTKYSEVVDISNYDGYAVTAIWTAAGATGSIELQASTDNINYISITGTSQSIAGSGSWLWNVYNPFYRYFRVAVASTLSTISTAIRFNTRSL